MRIKEEEEKEGQECCNKLEFLLHNKQTNKGFDRLISLSLSLSLFLWFTRSSRVAPFLSLLPVVARCENYSLLYFMKVNPFLLSFFFSLFLSSSFFPHATAKHTQHVNGEEKESFRRF